MNLEKELKTAIQGEVATDNETLTSHSKDASLFQVEPKAVVYPQSSEDIQAVVSLANKRGDFSLTARAAGSCMSGGSLTESVVIDVTQHMNNLKKLGDHQAIVEPGMYYRDFEKETLEHNLLMPSYPASKNLAAIGGMVANNAGGEKTLEYGKTEKYVKALKVVLADGNEYEVKPLSLDELAEKTRQNTFEGELYRKISQLLAEHKSLIQNAKPKVSKNSTGYNLWNIQHDGLFDLTQLFVGSQGTLGIITEVTFELITPKPHSRMLVMFLRSLEHLPEIVQRVLRHQPESFESYDDNTLRLAIKFLPQLVKRMKKKDLITLGFQFIPEIKLVLTGGLPQLVLIAEFTGHNEEEIIKRAKAAQSSVDDIVAATHVTKSEDEAEKYWTIRRESFSLLREKVKDKRTAPFIDDFIVQPDKLSEFLPKLEEILDQYDIFYTIAGHVGSGNFHIIPLMDLTDEKQRAIIPELAEKVYSLVFAFNGSMSGEHNDGIVRSPYLKQMYGEEVYKLFEETKHILDPKNIFNPGKKVGATKEYAKEHLVRE